MSNYYSGLLVTIRNNYYLLDFYPRTTQRTFSSRMSSIITSLKDLFTSVFEVIFSVFNGAIDTVSGLVSGLVNFVIGLIKMALHTVSNLLEAAGGVGKFVASKYSSSLRNDWKALIVDANRQYCGPWSNRWWCIRLRAVSETSRPHRQSWREEVELSLEGIESLKKILCINTYTFFDVGWFIV